MPGLLASQDAVGAAVADAGLGCRSGRSRRRTWATGMARPGAGSSDTGGKWARWRSGNGDHRRLRPQAATGIPAGRRHLQRTEKEVPERQRSESRGGERSGAEPSRATATYRYAELGGWEQALWDLLEIHVPDIGAGSQGSRGAPGAHAIFSPWIARSRPLPDRTGTRLSGRPLICLVCFFSKTSGLARAPIKKKSNKK